ncbi:aminopeptidase N [Polynucleobacter sp. IMCC 30228]|uniref:aminopeptidase N n=1 Tax=Polynucleobacter sp. IMCC 30228 TaxID=2781011 RepID=UPI001F2885AF|nr:aminopeptidase N [Polynucleobacter sp. IMCC 30228]MCE7528108.1 aminopeptidase N [Polynucleobacter sp. IMCC 30228]
MKNDLPLSFRRLEYTPPPFTFTQVALDFALNPERTIVKSRISVEPTTGEHTSLVLQGQDLEFISLRINGAPHRQFEITPELLTIHALPNQGKDAFILEIITACVPAKNTSLMGLYVSNGNFFTQCEAEGFRKITYFLDRPDVMARYRVTLRAVEADFPVLLSNGNLISTERLENGWHSAVWEDPFPKPCYLFALVAGKLACVEKKLTAASGASKLLQVWVEPHDLEKTQHALDSLVHAIQWDEKRFGLELDLERFMIVAVSDFNMGAMENKGLNIFNTKYVLAQPETATDADFAGIESVVAHEYFHNWTGNRVTCRDWFQLSLKEGLTVFRDQEFSADQIGSESGRAVSRIADVRLLRAAQFPEDAGPMAHPVRPDAYQEINNFYTVTIYEKGAEVVRMYQTLLGRDGFRKGMDLYFKRHDGQAVTCDEFLAAMADANGRDLSQFEAWYSQAGTPRVKVGENYDSTTQQYQLTLTQTCTSKASQAELKPFLIPLLMRLFVPVQNLSANTRANPQPSQIQPCGTEQLLEFSASSQTWTFYDVPQRPILSLNRGFSAPIILDFAQSETDLLMLLAGDDDPFNRWEAAQKLALELILAGRLPDARLLAAYRSILLDAELDPAFKDLVFTLPAESYLYEHCVSIEPLQIYAARQAYRLALAKTLQPDWLRAYQQMQTSGPYSPDSVSVGKRALKNLALSMLLLANPQDLSIQQLALDQYQQANNMTDRFGALAALVLQGASKATDCLADFYQRFADNPLVIDKWFTLQAMCSLDAPLERIRSLRNHPAFKMTNPNRVRSLIHAFCLANPAGFHQWDGSGYAFWAETVQALDLINPQVAARLARAADRWRSFAEPYQSKMRAALEQVAANANLSADVREVVNKALE